MNPVATRFRRGSSTYEATSYLPTALDNGDEHRYNMQKGKQATAQKQQIIRELCAETRAVTTG